MTAADIKPAKHVKGSTPAKEVETWIKSRHGASCDGWCNFDASTKPYRIEVTLPLEGLTPPQWYMLGTRGQLHSVELLPVTKLGARLSDMVATLDALEDLVQRAYGIWALRRALVWSGLLDLPSFLGVVSPTASPRLMELLRDPAAPTRWPVELHEPLRDLRDCILGGLVEGVDGWAWRRREALEVFAGLDDAPQATTATATETTPQTAPAPSAEPVPAEVEAATETTTATPATAPLVQAPQSLSPPYPWPGGKGLVVADVWAHLGADCAVALDPFFGGGSLILGRPGPVPRGCIEIINDLDRFVVNFWRTVQHSPDVLASWLEYPQSEVDLHARHLWLRTEGRDQLAALDMERDPVAHHPQIAAWWAWGQAQWIGGGWCGTTAKRRPKIKLNGVCRRVDLPAWMEDLAARLRHVSVWCGDWKRLLTDAVLEQPNEGSKVAILLDPPYSQAHRHHRAGSPLYAVDTDPAAEVRAWCLANGHRPNLRIALFGLEGEGHEALEAQGWTVKAWTARGMSNQGHDTPNKTRRHLERVWFSPACLNADTDKLKSQAETQCTLLDIKTLPQGDQAPAPPTLADVLTPSPPVLKRCASSARGSVCGVEAHTEEEVERLFGWRWITADVDHPRRLPQGVCRACKTAHNAKHGKARTARRSQPAAPDLRQADLLEPLPPPPPRPDFFARLRSICGLVIDGQWVGEGITTRRLSKLEAGDPERLVVACEAGALRCSLSPLGEWTVQAEERPKATAAQLSVWARAAAVVSVALEIDAHAHISDGPGLTGLEWTRLIKAVREKEVKP